MAIVKGDWSKEDNKRYRGNIDRINVAMSEPWEVEYYIDHYLETHGWGISTENRKAIAGGAV